MNTKQAFKCLVKHWNDYPSSLTTQHRLSKSRFLSGKDLSEKKMESVLLKFGFVVVQDKKIIWQKPNNK